MSEEQFILTADPSFIDLALAELQAMSELVKMQTLNDGVLLITTTDSFWEVAERWRLVPPIFVRHICPVQSTVPLGQNQTTDLAILRQTVAEVLLDMVDPSLPLSVQSRILTPLPYKPFDINSSLATYLQTAANITIDVRTPHQVLSVVCAHSPAEQTTQLATRNAQPIA